MESELAKQAEASTAIVATLAVLDRVASDEVDAAIARIDAELSQELLRNSGRVRAASAVARATRWRGAGIAVDVPEPEFSELVLFPLADVVERIVPTSIHGAPAANALQIIRCLTDHAVTIDQLDHGNLSVGLPAAPTPGTRSVGGACSGPHGARRTNQPHYEEMPSDHSARPRASTAIAGVAGSVHRVLGAGTGSLATALLERARVEPREKPRMVLTGQFSSGKSSLIKALTDGAVDPVIDADIPQMRSPPTHGTVPWYLSTPRACSLVCAVTTNWHLARSVMRTSSCS